jgi:hypothetical protein
MEASLSFQDQGSPQGAQQAHRPRWNEHSFKPGVSGNPLGGALRKRRTEAQQARYNELVAALAKEFPKATVIETALIQQCADCLERANRRDPRGYRETARLSNAGLRLLERLKKDHAARAPKKRLPSPKELGLE